MEVLRRCPLAIAQRLVHCATALSTAVLDSHYIIRRCRPAHNFQHTTFNTLDDWAIKPPPNRLKRKRTGKKRLYNTLGYKYMKHAFTRRERGKYPLRGNLHTGNVTPVQKGRERPKQRKKNLQWRERTWACMHGKGFSYLPVNATQAVATVAVRIWFGLHA